MAGEMRHTLQDYSLGALSDELACWSMSARLSSSRPKVVPSRRFSRKNSSSCMRVVRTYHTYLRVARLARGFVVARVGGHSCDEVCETFSVVACKQTVQASPIPRHTSSQSSQSTHQRNVHPTTIICLTTGADAKIGHGNSIDSSDGVALRRTSCVRRMAQSFQPASRISVDNSAKTVGTKNEKHARG